MVCYFFCDLSFWLLKMSYLRIKLYNACIHFSMIPREGKVGYPRSKISHNLATVKLGDGYIGGTFSYSLFFMLERFQNSKSEKEVKYSVSCY